MPKVVENTVFVKLIPTPTYKVQRHQLEDIFSQFGPIKKSSWINSQSNSSSKGYGFVKYLSLQDAEAAASKLNNTQIRMDDKPYRVKVELASLKAEKPAVGTPNETSTLSEAVDDDTSLKKRSRVIVRNLSFYAKDTDVRKIMEQRFGKVVDVHIPRVQANLHVGFCFVTFASSADAQKAVDLRSVDIKKRSVSVEWSVPKRLHKQLGARAKPSDNEEPTQGAGDVQVSTEDGGVSDSDNSSTGRHDLAEDDSRSTEAEDNEVEDMSVSEKRTLFLRNLAFDTTRHDLFQIFRKFGRVEGIYLVKDKESGMLKGTAFVSFEKHQNAQRAVEELSAGESEASAQRPQSSTSKQVDGGSEASDKKTAVVVLRGRKVNVDFAVDKETAAAFDIKGSSTPSADRRNMYLLGEARVGNDSDGNEDDPNSWDNLPVSDQKKRQTALTDKTTKLKSPLFFINPTRLSFRNMAKHIDELGLRRLCEIATKRGLEKGLVGAKDQIAHLQASGTMSTRDILLSIQEKEARNESVIPLWSKDDVSKKLVPSVYIDRDYSAGAKKSTVPSRGFGFAEFAHHVHALACLRELNNNSTYSAEYATGGKAADAQRKKGGKGKTKNLSGENDGRILLPRLIVDFAVENRVKAKKQAERRLQQQKNQMSQRATDHESTGAEKAKKRNRGASQRERKRQKRTAGGEKAGDNVHNSPSEDGDLKELSVDEAKETEKVVRSKKMKRSHSNQTKRTSTPRDSKAEAGDGGIPTAAKKGRRWFE